MTATSVSSAPWPARSSEPFTAEVDRITESDWNSLLGEFSDATVYQSWPYGAVTWGEIQLSHVVLKQGSVPVALAQLRLVRLPLVGAGIAYVRWGPVCVRNQSVWDPKVWRAAVEALVKEYVVRRRLLLRIIPHAFQQDAHAVEMADVLRQMGFVEDSSVRTYRTLRVSLRPSLEDLRRRLSARWRRQLNIAERNTLDVVAANTDDLYRQFLTLYDEMMNRKRFETGVDPKAFARIQQRLSDSQKMNIFICRLNGRPVAGLVVDVVGKTAIYLLAATGDDGLQARGSYLLQWTAMQHLKEQGREWYDLGGINPQTNPGVFTFKSGLGGEDALNLGGFCLSTSILSRWAVAAGEGMTRFTKHLRRKQ